MEIVIGLNQQKVRRTKKTAKPKADQSPSESRGSCDGLLKISGYWLGLKVQDLEYIG